MIGRDAARVRDALYYVDFRDRVEGVTAALTARPDCTPVGQDRVQGLSRWLLVHYDIDVAVTVGPRRDSREPVLEWGCALMDPPDEVADFERALERWAREVLAAAEG